MPKRFLNPVSDGKQRRTLDIPKKQSTLVQHGINKPPIPNERNAYAVYLFEF